MGFRVTTDEQLGIARVEYHGHTTDADRAASMDALAPLLLQTGVQRVLVDYSGAVVVDAFRARTVEDPDAGLMQGELGERRVAVVGLAADEAHSLEMAGRVRRFDVRAFSGRRDAIRWLTRGTGR